MKLFRDLHIPKINTVGIGGIWIATGLVIGAVLPYVIWLITDRVIWPLVIIGGVILAAFVVVFIVEMIQDNGVVPYYEKDLRETVPFDSEKQYAAVRSSICTGEKIAGFVDKSDGHFTEVMLIRTPQDEQRFKEIYDIDTIKKIY